MTVTAQISAAYHAAQAAVQGGRRRPNARRCLTQPRRQQPAPAMPALQDAAADAAAALVAAQATSIPPLAAPMAASDALLDRPTASSWTAPTSIIPNVAPDEGLSAPFNSWFTLFGQFFDHGLDLVDKGGSGTVFIPLQPDDPLYVPGSHDQLHGADPRHRRGRAPTASSARPTTSGRSTPRPPFVDQNQTYTSHPSHQVFLREYVLNADGDPVATGKLIEGANGGMATWAEVKAQAATCSASS